MKKVSKTTLLSLVLLLAVLGNITPAFAAGEEKYRDLWGIYTAPDPVEKGTVQATAGTQSGLFYKGATLFNGGVTEFYLGANLIFPGISSSPTNEEVQAKFWDFVSHGNKSENGDDDHEDTFLIRFYQFDDAGRPTNIKYRSQIYTPFLRQAPAASMNSFYKEEAYTDTNGVRRFGSMVDQKISVPIRNFGVFPYGSKVGADFWYCGGVADEGSNAGAYPRGDFKADAIPQGFADDVAFFDGKCGGTAYWKIGPSITFTMPASAADGAGGATTVDQAAGTNSTTPSYSIATPEDGNLPECGFTHIIGCAARIVYYIIYRPIAWFAGIMGKLFDFFLGYSLSDASYRAQFAVRGWQIVRDLSNIFFIIILVYTGLMAVFSNKNNMKSVVPQLILNALLINFSLFGTRVVIDISNVVARVFYRSIHVCDGPCKDDLSNTKEGIGGYVPLSEKIVSAFNPQKIFSPELLGNAAALPDNGTSQTTQRTLTTGTNEYAGYYAVVSLIAAAILFAVALMFWKTAFFFVGRVIGLYVAMIFAPFAVLSKGSMPIVSNVKELSWTKWSEDLIRYAMLAPIFVFFLYVIYSFLDATFLKMYSVQIGGNFLETVAYIAIPLIIVYFMISKGVSLAEKYAGDFGKQVTGWANKATGLVGGAALGGTALVGGRVLGAAATSLNKSKAGEWLRDVGKSTGIGGWLARRSVSTLNATEKASFDFRKSTIGQSLFKEMGVNTDQKALSALSGMGLGLGTKNTENGYQGQVERYQKRQEAESKLLESKQSQGDIDAFNEKNKKDYQSKIDKIIEDEMNAIHGKANVDDWKVNDPNKYEAERQVVMLSPTIQATINAVEKPIEKKSVQEMNAERKDKFAEDLKKGSMLDQFLGEDSLVGAMLGANVRMTAEKKAAKKISDSAKIEKDLTEINNTLKGGFREIVAMDKLRNDPLWTTSLTAAERTSLMRGEKITFTNSAGQQVEGGFYDYVKDKDPNLAGVIDIDVTSAENDKDEKKKILDQIKARQQFKFDFKPLNAQIKTAEATYAGAPTQANLDALNQLKAERVRLKNEQKKWQDLDKYIEEQKKKLEGKE